MTMCSTAGRGQGGSVAGTGRAQAVQLETIMDQDTVGFIGLGNMGGPMAGHIARTGRDLIAYDSAGTQSRAPAGARSAASTPRVAEAAGIIFLSLPTVAAGRSVVAEIAGTDGAEGSLVVNTATVGLKAAREAHAVLARRGIDYVDAPISGMAFRAQEGTLATMYSGSAGTLERLRPLLESYSTRVHHVGTEPGQGQLMKLVNNYLAIASFVTTSEALVTGMQGGLDLETMLGVIESSSGQNFIASAVFPRHMVTGTFDSGGSATLPHKDLDLYVEAASDADTPRHVARAALDVLEAFAAHDPDADQSTIYRFIRDGLSPG